MTPSDAMMVAREAIFVTLKMGAPAMLLALVVGLAVSFVQALTQIQEATLTFVPKMIVILLSLLLLLPFMLQTLSAFTRDLMERIISG
jgi:flagellar biosynthesis protein FliQ